MQRDTHSAMKPVLVLALCLGAACALPHALQDDAKYKLPDGFLFGAGTSSYQTEGAWDKDGKGENVLDHYYHSNNVPSNETGDVAADFYHRYKEDIALASELGLNVIRFSISWARIYPDGKTVNPQGVQHYHNVLDEMIARNITPMVTLSHFDHPQALEDELQGWLGDGMVDAFKDFADYMFEQYGSKVKYWLTINEASFYCKTLGSNFLAPMAFKTEEQQNTCLKNTILAHAKAHKLYHEKYHETQKGWVGFGAGPLFSRPATDSEADVAAAESANEASGIALSVDPLVFGDYPESVRDSMIQFTDEEKLLIKGRVDYLGINVYGGQTANASASGGGGGGNSPDGFGGAESAWVLRVMPLWVKNRYDKTQQLPIFITENGVNAKGNGSALNDWDSRAVYSSAFLREMCAGVHENGTRVFGYTAWSLVDTFEFQNGFSNWGMIHVDFASGSLNRTLKASSTLYKTIMKTGFVPLVEEGSEPLPDPNAPPKPNRVASLQSSILMTLVTLITLQCFQ